mmetsp:Transcript_9567/g.14770  ORF Transcript_9567/g.14770 Transcript_9567/m.14770 type:complete len:145 (+) Transcript_9567:150-584(+)
MEDQPGNCNVIGEGTDGKTASEACCACGGGDDDRLCENESEWFVLNKNGEEKDCDWFEKDADVRCEKHGEKEGEFDLTANQACCACGGGDLPRQCTDEDDWYVSHHNDKDYNCDWFAKDPDTRCEKHGNRVGKYDMTADEISSV